jgi:hypothetical protein
MPADLKLGEMERELLPQGNKMSCLIQGVIVKLRQPASFNQRSDLMVTIVM